jgi:PAS domain S-box-containing protein
MATLEEQLKVFGLNKEDPPSAAAWQAFLHHVRQAEQANLLRAELFSTLSLPNFENIIIHDTRGRILDTNRNARQISGYGLTELNGQPLRQLFTPESYPIVERAMREANPLSHEVVLQHKEGQHIPAELIARQMTINNQPIQALLTRSIADRKDIEQELERQLRQSLLLNQVIAAVTSTLEPQELLHILCQQVAQTFELSSVAFAILDREEKNLVIIAEHLDETQPPALGTIIPIANNPTTQYVVKNKVPLLILNTQTDPRYESLREIARQRGTVTVLVVPILRQGKVIGTLGLNTIRERNFTKGELQLAQHVAAAASKALENAQLHEALQEELTERRRTEIELAKARDEALEANRLQAEFVAKVSHELRTPLNAILGYTEMLQLGIYGGISARQQEITHTIMKRTEELISFVNDLLDQAHLESGTFVYTPHPFAPRHLVEHMFDTMSLLAQNKNLNLSAEVAPDLPLVIIGDVERLNQIVANLISNAIKFTDAGDVHLRLFRHDETQWGIAVSDTGRGIAPEAQEYIFEAFRQTVYSMTRQHAGVGLGLSIVKQLTVLMGGTISLHSVENQGSTFTILLPLTIAQEKTA